MNYLETVTLEDNPKDPLIRCFLSYCLPFLQKNYEHELIHQIPDLHKKAIIAVHIASQLVYKRGLDWSPSIVDILPLILKEMEI